MIDFVLITNGCSHLKHTKALSSSATITIRHNYDDYKTIAIGLLSAIYWHDLYAATNS